MKTKSSLFAALGVLALASQAFSQNATTTPVGAVTLTVAAGSGTARTVTVISIPLIEEASLTGQMSGKISSLTSSSITNGSAAWTAGELSTPSAPCLIQITSGNAIGRIFLISSATPNTVDTLTVDSEEASLVDLTTLGIAVGANGDTYRILNCDTLSSFFGTPGTTGIQGAATSAGADIVQMFVSGAWRQYYFDTDSSDWRRIGPNTASNNVAIKPDAGIMYSRLPASSLALTVPGIVPSVARKAILRNSGTTFLAQGWPVDITLGTSGVDSTPGWLKSSSPASADIVQFQVGGAWRQYYHNGTQWLRVGPNTASNAVVIPSGSAVMISKKGSASGATSLDQSMPYSLN